MKLNTRKRLEGTAHHEAGHVVAHWVLGLATKSVSIVACDDYNGLAVSPGVYGYEATGRREQKTIARLNIIASYAGMEAELLFDPAADRTCGAGDVENAFELSRTYGVHPPGGWIGDDRHLNYLDRLRIQSRRLMKRHWRAVESLAGELLKRKKLSGAKLADLQAKLLPDI